MFVCKRGVLRPLSAFHTPDVKDIIFNPLYSNGFPIHNDIQRVKETKSATMNIFLKKNIFFLKHLQK